METNSSLQIYYSLNEGCYLVNEYCKGAIYDLNNASMHCFNRDGIKLVEYLIQSYKKGDELNVYQRIILTFLLKKQLIKPCENRQPLRNIKELAEPQKITFSWIEVTRTCNLSCSFCYESSNPFCTEKMSFDDFKLVVENLLSIGVNRYTIHWW